MASAGVASALALVAAACTQEPIVLPEIPVAVSHGDETVTVEVTAGESVDEAVRTAGLEGVDGQVLAVVSGEPLGPNDDPATFLLDGEPARSDRGIWKEGTIQVVDGTDSVEETVVEQREIEPEGMPRAIQYVQFGGTAGVEEVTVGAESGEVVERETLEPAVDAHRATGKVLSLTFDDGPSPTYTEPVLAILKDKGVKATFCQVGSAVDKYPELTQKVVDAGHQLCNHTQNHPEDLGQQPRAVVEPEIVRGREAITEASGSAPPYYRPPAGSLGPAVYEVAADQDEDVLYWSIDPQDWRGASTEEIALRVIGGFGPGGIILLHDGGGNRDATVEALPAIIDFAHALGYTFTPPVSRRSVVG